MDKAVERTKTGALVLASALTAYWWVKPFLFTEPYFEQVRQSKMPPNRTSKPVAAETASSSNVKSEQERVVGGKKKIIGDELPKRPTGKEMGWLQSFHNYLYPPESEYYWYREGLIGHSDWSLKYVNALVWCFVTALAGTGSLMGLVVYVLHNFLQVASDHLGYQAESDEPFWKPLTASPSFCLSVMCFSSLFTAVSYYYGASRLENAFNFNPELQGKEAQWKCQPNRSLTDDLYREEVRSGMMNALLAGFLGTGLFLLDANYPFFKFVYTLEQGYFNFFRGFVIVFLWIDIWAYFMHRFLHLKFIYKYVHKWHHRYKAPTAFSAFAMNPLEFQLFQCGGVFCCCVFEIHIMAFFGVVTWIAYHGQVDHSGIAFEGDMPWQPSTFYHDDHHQYFHLNFGQSLILWDWMFGTLRTKKRVYGEDKFEGDQEVKAKAS